MVIAAICERQSGKTTEAIRLFMQDPDNTLYLCRNKSTCNTIINMIYKDYGRTLTTKQLGNIKSAVAGTTIGMSYPIQTVIFDEFFWFMNYEQTFLEVKSIHRANGDMYIFGTTRDDQVIKNMTFIEKVAIPSNIYHSMLEFKQRDSTMSIMDKAFSEFYDNEY